MLIVMQGFLRNVNLILQGFGGPLLPTAGPALSEIVVSQDRSGVLWFYVPRRDRYVVTIVDQLLSVRVARPNETQYNLLGPGEFRADLCSGSQYPTVVAYRSGSRACPRG